MATTADYLNKLVTQKNTLADNLITKGVTATHNETLETLVPKVLDISGGSSSKSKYISDGLIKSIILNEVDTSAECNILINNMPDIIISEEMTVECCCVYTGFGNSSNKGRIFMSNAGGVLIGMSMYNNILEAAMSISSSGWATDGTTGITVDSDEFVTLAMTSNSSGTQFLKNGVVYGNYSDNISSLTGSIINNISIKYNAGRDDRNLIGKVYMLRFYNRILSTSELYANAQADIKNYNVK